jgi:putative acetyltransferase
MFLDEYESAAGSLMQVLRMHGLRIGEDDLTGEAVLDLLRLHLAGMRANSPPESVFALDVSGLKAPGITVWSAWDGARICGIGALRVLPAGIGEVKSMRTHPDFLRRGVAAALLERIIAEARARGLKRLSLETGRGDAFEPPLALYRRRGFVEGGAFGDYAEGTFSRFLHLELA